MPLSCSNVAFVVGCNFLRGIVMLLLLSSPFSLANNAPQQAQNQAPHYDEVQALFDHKCIACHACYDAPCQLNLQSSEGLNRGASKLPVYNGRRLKNAVPTRLFHDAHSIAEWRKQSFFPVVSDPAGVTKPQPSTVLKRLVEQAYQRPLETNTPLPKHFEVGIGRQHACPTPKEIDTFIAKQPQYGMPFGVTGLNEQEFNLLMRWFEAGAPRPETRSQSPLNSKYAKQIEQWEQFFNRPQKKHKLLARYLYEHLFLGHLYLTEQGGRKGEFFRLVRSRTSGDEAIQLITTRRPNDDPQGAVYYRLLPITETIVHKTHITYPLTADTRQRWEQLFYAEDWSVNQLPGYDYETRSNPFIAFRDIPAKARYQFMLDHAEYFTRNFIRGPVCHGPVATSVIRDHFWTLFEDPEHEQFVNDASYRERVTPLLGLPGQKTDIMDLGGEWLRYQRMRNDYLAQRQIKYREAFADGARVAHVWDGEGTNPDAYLTIFRHHDNASVNRGLHGRTPRTIWLMDYPLLERSYYELVVGFDVFGSVSHQAQTRLYFDLIRNGAEQNFLRFMPMPQREKLYDNWYRQSGKFKILLSYQDLDVESPVGISYTSRTPMQEFSSRIFARTPVLAQSRDLLNRCSDNDCTRGLSVPEVTVTHALRSLTQERANTVRGILQLPNLSFVHVDLPNGEYRVYSLIRNRAHSNVAFILGEDLRYLPEEDSVSVVPYLAGSYPNFMFRLNWREAAVFAKAIANMVSEEDRRKVVDRWGVRRTHPDFWQIFHGFRAHLTRQDPKEAGVFDMNRYEAW